MHIPPNSFLTVETPIYSFLVRSLAKASFPHQPYQPIPLLLMYVRILPVCRKQCMSLTETNKQNVMVSSLTAYETTTYKHVHMISVMEGMVIYRTVLLQFFYHHKFSTIQITIRDEVTGRTKHRISHITKR
jgi:hypothetical protein